MKHLLLVVALCLFAISSFGQSETQTNSANTGMVSITGENFGSDELNGKIVVLNFWYTSCPPCRKEIPELNKLVAEYNGKDVVFLALATDDKKSLEAFLKEYPFEYQIIPSATQLMLSFLVPDEDGILEAKFPTHIVIDRERKLAVYETGLKGIEAVRAELLRQFPTESTMKPDSKN